MVAGRDDNSGGLAAAGRQNAAPEEDLDEHDGECQDSDYEVVDRRWRQPGGLDFTYGQQLRLAAKKVALAYGRQLPVDAVEVAPWSACAFMGQLRLVLSPAAGAWRARLTQGLLGWDRAHLWADGATPLGALDALVLAARADAARQRPAVVKLPAPGAAPAAPGAPGPAGRLLSMPDPHQARIDRAEGRPVRR